MAAQLNAKWDFKAVTSLAGNGRADEWMPGFPSCTECCQRQSFLSHIVYCTKSGASREEGGDWESSRWDTPRTLRGNNFCRPHCGLPSRSKHRRVYHGGSDGKESLWSVGVVVLSLSHVQLFVIPWIIACQTSLSCNVGDLGSISGLGKSPGEGNGNPLQYSCLENSMDSQRVRHDWVTKPTHKPLGKLHPWIPPSGSQTPLETCLSYPYFHHSVTCSLCTITWQW